ncbi:MAG: DegT/DnrJ/EryC1/StrS family aminotransferase [Bacteroidota bacterium]
MNNIRMVDTITQYEHIQQEVDAAVMEVVRSGAYINGPAVQSFKQKLANYLDVPFVIPCANGTDALQIAFMALGLKPGDEVITPSFTFIATVEVIALLGLKPVFVDVKPDTFNLDPCKIEAAITEKTKAIVPVHLYGQTANMEPIMEVARRHKLFVVEDTAQAIGADYCFSDGTAQKAGTIGDIGCTSFYPSKNLGAFGDGGAIFTRNEELAQRIQKICNHGSDKRYYHEEVGVNSRLDSIQAAILSVKLGYLDEYNAARRRAAAHYNEAFAQVPGVVTPMQASYGSHVFHQYTLRLVEGRERRDAVKAFFDEHKVPAMVYYPVPCHLQSAFTSAGYREGDLTVTEQLTAEVLSLPMHSELSVDQLAYIENHLLKALTVLIP